MRRDKLSVTPRSSLSSHPLTPPACTSFWDPPLADVSGCGEAAAASVCSVLGCRGRTLILETYCFSTKCRELSLDQGWTSGFEQCSGNTVHQSLRKGFHTLGTSTKNAVTAPRLRVHGPQGSRQHLHPEPATGVAFSSVANSCPRPSII